MKINCDRLRDWLKLKKQQRAELKKLEAEVREQRKAEWHNRFVIYHKFGHGDCRMFEVIQRRMVKKFYIRDSLDEQKTYYSSMKLCLELVEVLNKPRSKCYSRRVALWMVGYDFEPEYRPRYS